MLLEVQWENCYTTWIYNFVVFYKEYMYVFICLVARINQRVFRNSSLQMFPMRVHGK